MTIDHDSDAPDDDVLDDDLESLLKNAHESRTLRIVVNEHFTNPN